VTALITTLIDKVDNCELVRDKIAEILLVESAAQQVLAAAADPVKDPALWKLRVFLERSNPWGEWTDARSTEDAGQQPIDTTPIVNVAFDGWVADKKSGNVVERQKVTGTFNIDCYGYGVSADLPAGGHAPGDEAAAVEAQRAFRLVRNILMSGHYTYLGFARGANQVVWSRWPGNVNAFQPAIDGRPVAHVQAVRLQLQVEFNEFSPQVEGVTLKELSVVVTRGVGGEAFLTAQYGESPP
jgi:hypothetical protein